MHSIKVRLLAVALAAAVGGTVACDSDSSSKAESGEAKAEAVETTEEEAPAKESKPETKLEDLPFYAKGPVATVDGVDVPADRFNFIAERRAQQIPGSVPPQMLEIYKKQTLDMVIDEHLIERKIKGENVEVTDAEIEEALNEFKSRFPSEDVFKSFMEHNQIDEKIIREDIGKDVALRKIVGKTHDLEISEEKAKAFYDEHKERFHQAEEVHARHILLKLDANADDATVDEVRKKAEAIAKEAQGGADFAELAKQKSEGPTAPRGGDLGYFAKNRMVPEFAEVAFKQKPGTISDPVRTQFGWHVIKVEDRREERDLPFEEVREQIEMQLQSTVLREAIGQFLEELKKDAKIERKEDNIVVKVAAAAPPAGQPGGIPGLGDPSKLQLQLGKPGDNPQQPAGDQHSADDGHGH